MKNLLLLITLLFTTSAYAQVTYDNGVCSQPVTGGTVAYGCTFTPDPVDPPPPPPPPSAPYTKLVCIGDSWTDDAGGADDRQHPKWCTKLAEQYGIPRDLVAVRGWTTSQILGLVVDHLGQNGGLADSGALYGYWILPNEYRQFVTFPGDQPTVAEWRSQYPIIRGNVQATFQLLKDAGAQHFVFLNNPASRFFPASQGSSLGDFLTDELNAEYFGALDAVGLAGAYYDVDPIFGSHTGPLFVQSDEKHPTEAVHQAVADELYVFLGQ